MAESIPPVPGGFGCFGKLPGAGDFVSRRMPHAVQQFWDGWCAEGVDAMKAASPASGLEVWGATPAWGFVVPAQPGVATAQLGVLVPSCDRVGRVFPFLVVAPFGTDLQPVMLDFAAQLGLAWCEAVTLAQEAKMGIDAVDARLQAALADTLAIEPAQDEDEDEGATLPLGLSPPSLPWPDLGHTFDPGGSESYWWSVPPADTGFQTRVHTGPLRTVHFLDLCR
ncbi:MAG: hypothetical protein JWQ33_1159 [Ramlibacter sp.]|nr:hypothetical protein [Ramlibacter sp.]